MIDRPAVHSTNSKFNQKLQQESQPQSLLKGPAIQTINKSNRSEIINQVTLSKKQKPPSINKQRLKRRHRYME